MKYKQMNGELVQDKKLSVKIMQMKKHLLFKMCPYFSTLKKIKRKNDLF